MNGAVVGAPPKIHGPAPLADALSAWAAKGIRALHTPGHKGRARLPGLDAWLTRQGIACDLPAMDATGNWFAPEGPVADAQRLYASACGVAETHFLVNGATSGVHAMLLAAAGDGDVVLLSRQSHLSVFAALVLSGARPVYLPSRWSPAAGPLPPTADEVAQALAEHPEARAVFLTQPSYYGLGRPLTPVAELCRARGALLLVDEAHGAHLPFLPAGHLRSAVGQGADLVVQSAHKTLGSLVGTAVIHRPHGSRVTADRLLAALKLLGSTSPSYLLLASLDLCRRWLDEAGRPALARAVARATKLRASIARLKPLAVLSLEQTAAWGGCQIDPLRLLVSVAATGLSGYEVERRLLAEHGVLGEFADAANVAFVLGPADAADARARLLRGLKAIAAAAPAGATRGDADGELREVPRPEMVLTPREAFRCATETVRADAAAGRIAAESISQYPPGIPVLVPGERIAPAALAACAEGLRRGYHFVAADPALATIRVTAG